MWKLSPELSALGVFVGKRVSVGQMSPVLVTGPKEHRTLTLPLLLLLLLLLNGRSEAGHFILSHSRHVQPHVCYISLLYLTLANIYLSFASATRPPVTLSFRDLGWDQSPPSLESAPK